MNNHELRLAILHNVISNLDDAGKTRLQKLGYFLQEAFCVSTKYPFKMHHYGPYSEALETDIARLKLAGYIDIQPDQQGFGFHITSIDSPPEEWAKLTEPFDRLIQKAIKDFGKRPTQELELAATIHFVKSLFPNITSCEVVTKVRALKPKFDADYIHKVHDELKENELLS